MTTIIVDKIDEDTINKLFLLTTVKKYPILALIVRFKIDDNPLNEYIKYLSWFPPVVYQGDAPRYKELVKRLNNDLNGYYYLNQISIDDLNVYGTPLKITNRCK